MKVLIYTNRKSNAVIWDASTQAKESAAFLALFTLLKDEYEVYDDMETVPDGTFTRAHRDQRELYASAVLGHAGAAERLLRLRQSYEYEGWSFATVLDPMVTV